MFCSFCLCYFILEVENKMTIWVLIFGLAFVAVLNLILGLVWKSPICYMLALWWGIIDLLILVNGV